VNDRGKVVIWKIFALCARLALERIHGWRDGSLEAMHTFGEMPT